jgi:alkylhydroperoxidase/carboxymuconolactone decarboxylase family protein YurZ
MREAALAHPRSPTAPYILAIKQAGYSEDQIFELVVAAAVGRACSMAEQALSVLHAALKPPTP